MPKPRRNTVQGSVNVGGQTFTINVSQQYLNTWGQTQQTQQPQQPVNPLQNQMTSNKGVPVLDDAATVISDLDDDQLAALYTASQTADMPDQLNDVTGRANTSQRFIYQAGLNGKPQVMDAQTFDNYVRQNGLSGRVLRRDINPTVYNVGTTRYTFTGSDIADQIRTGRFNYVGGKQGGAAHGYGTYFDMGQMGTRTGYGGSRCVTLQAVLNPQTAKVINEHTLYQKAPAFARSHPKFAAAAGSINSTNQAIYATAMGYNVVNAGNGYFVVIDRSAMICRDKDF